LAGTVASETVVSEGFEVEASEICGKKDGFEVEAAEAADADGEDEDEDEDGAEVEKYWRVALRSSSMLLKI
jgi:hypothetical protein